MRRVVPDHQPLGTGRAYDKAKLSVESVDVGGKEQPLAYFVKGWTELRCQSFSTVTGGNSPAGTPSPSSVVVNVLPKASLA